MFSLMIMEIDEIAGNGQSNRNNDSDVLKL